MRWGPARRADAGPGPLAGGRLAREERGAFGSGQPQGCGEQSFLGVGFSRHARVSGQSLQRLMNGEQAIVCVGGDVHCAGSDALEVAAMPRGLLASRTVDQDAAHRFGRGAKEVGPILPGRLIRAAKPQPGLVHQGGGLQRLARRFAGHFLRRELVQLFIDKTLQFARGGGVAELDGVEQSRQVIHRVGWRSFGFLSLARRAFDQRLGLAHEDMGNNPIVPLFVETGFAGLRKTRFGEL